MACIEFHLKCFYLPRNQWMFAFMIHELKLNASWWEFYELRVKRQCLAEILYDSCNRSCIIERVYSLFFHTNFCVHFRNNQKNIPFRESKLTRLFQGFFSGKGKASMIVNVNPCASAFDETLHALKFSAIAKKVRSVTILKIFNSPREIQPYFLFS